MAISSMQNFTAIDVVLILPYVSFLMCIFIIRRGKPLSDPMVAALIFLQVFLYRIPYILANAPLQDPDEDIILSVGLNLLHNPVIFDSIAPASMGIIHAYIAMLVEWHRPVAEYAYSILHFLSAVAHSLCLFLLYLSLKNLFSYWTAIFGITIGLLCLVLNNTLDFACYHNEIESIVLISLSIYLLSKMAKSPAVNIKLLAKLGITLGCVPYAKLQGIPIAIALAVCALFLIIKSKSIVRRRVAGVLAITLFGLVPTIILISLLEYNNLLADFYFYYIRSNLAYSYKLNFVERLTLFITEMPYQFKFSMVTLISLIIVSFRKISRIPMFYLIVLVFIASYLSIARSGSFFAHYYSYLLFFVTIGSGLGYTYLENDKYKITAWAILVIICITSLTTSLVDGKNYLSSAKLLKIQQSEAAKVILGFRQSSDDSIAIWGWYPVLSVETNLPSATKENHTFYTSFSPYRDEFERRYVSDLIRFKPFVFVDSKTMWCGPYIPFQEKPLLAAYIQENYVFYQTVSASSYYDRELVDIYVSKERLLGSRR